MKFELSILVYTYNPIYGYVMDKNTRQNIPICGNRQMENSDKSSTTTLYVSRSNHLQIVSDNNEDLKFIVRIEGYYQLFKNNLY